MKFEGLFGAVLLVGPTGCGKSPLGQLLERVGLKGMKCLHFDFGKMLRKINSERPAWLNHDEINTIEKMINTGALLEDEHFPIAKKILLRFINERKRENNNLIVLNGLPRHIEQAKAMENVIDIVAVVSLECAPEIVWERVRTNAGGDRSERTDDTLKEVKGRLVVFAERTVPMLKYYGGRGVPIIHLPVAVKTSSEEMHSMLERCPLLAL